MPTIEQIMNGQSVKPPPSKQVKPQFASAPPAPTVSLPLPIRHAPRLPVTGPPVAYDARPQTSPPTSLLPEDQTRIVKGPLSGHVGAFVMELAARLEPTAVILDRYGVSKADFKELLKDKTFRGMVKEAAAQYTAAANTGKRIKLKAQLVTEMLIDDIYTIAADAAQPASARVQAFAAVRALTGLEKPEAEVERSKFSLTINLPNSEKVVIEGTGDTPHSASSDTDVSESPVPIISPTTNHLPAVPKNIGPTP